MIEKIIHQVWVGDKEPPTEWMDTWKNAHPEWKYILWDNFLVKNYPFKNRKHINKLMEEKKYHGVADIVRYEAVYDMGGIALPADSKCVNPIDELIDREAFTCYENEVHYPGRLTPIVGAIKGNKFLKEVIDGLLSKDYIGEPWIDCGNKYLTDIYEKTQYKIDILPSYFFMPNHRLGGNWNGEKIYSYQFSSTTFSNIGVEDPIVSIVIPVWGEYERFLPQCLQSIQEQTYRNFEVVISNIPNLSAARNDGIRRAKGKYILPLDVDDILEKTYLEKVVYELDHYDIVTTDHSEFGESSSKSDWAEDITLEMILNGNKLIACSAFKKDLWEKIGGYDETFNSGLEDWDFWIRAAETGATIKRIKEVLYFYRKISGSMSDGLIYNLELENKLKKKHENLYRNSSIHH